LLLALDRGIARKVKICFAEKIDIFAENIEAAGSLRPIGGVGGDLVIRFEGLLKLCVASRRF
jgi:hypothetical protein